MDRYVPKKRDKNMNYDIYVYNVCTFKNLFQKYSILNSIDFDKMTFI